MEMDEKLKIFEPRILGLNPVNYRIYEKLVDWMSTMLEKE
jgi:hypothetical protein